MLCVNMGWQDISIVSRAIVTTLFYGEFKLFYGSYEFMLILEYLSKLRSWFFFYIMRLYDKIYLICWTKICNR